MADAYPSYPYEHQRLQGVRCRPLTGAFHRYVVSYRVEENRDVEVLRVLHAAQDLDRILGGGQARLGAGIREPGCTKTAASVC